ncbi:amino acid adenylation domain-containing protein [Actinokineospora alba]|uniref:Amino acid adenylation domain-containing protein n=1 Tax=Actinokineospora alba TaxID=504798 RepID=A0A1H0FC21_9PSEU|nr:non-ribosomal peptide synthetase [Actinokineospora alba]TDP69417.1 amino acid adenylation domain-containing protein [Actinokineospora alba]SDI17214.1 amino acid adenylation domain-containing protein [Actinokineospora alba]SDN92052.1 amino acid adenylation domain-containing protein [Actinokineospora alba]
MVLTGRASFAQERLYFLNELQPGNPAYVVAFALRVEGELRVTALTDALRRVVARHDSLRTTYQVAEGVLHQHIQPNAEPDIDVSAVAWTDQDSQDEQLRELVAAESAKPFTLGTGPLLRAWIRSWGPDEHALVVLIHHIACDGWSVGLVLNDLAAEYNAITAGAEGAQYPGEAESYLRYSQAQRAEWEDNRAGLSFWRKELNGAPKLALPTDFPRPSVLGCAGAVVRRRVDTDLVDRLTGWAKRHGTTLFTVSLAAYASVLSRYTGQDDVVIGVPVANRMEEGEDALVGCLVNTLPVRIDLSGAPTFTELVHRARTASLSAFSWQSVPFEQIVHATAGERELSHAPLFQTALTVQNFPFAFPDLDGVKLTEVDVEIEAAKFDLGVTLDVSTDIPFLRAEFSTELFDPSTATTLLDHYLTFLTSIVDEEAEPSMVGADERAQLTTYPPVSTGHPSVLARFVEQAQSNPAGVAIRHQGRDLSYGELDRWSDRVAAGLAAAGVAKGDLVGLLLRRSPAVVAAILGIWKAGGAYVPLDPEYPRQRLDLIAGSASTPVMLAEPDTVDLAEQLTAGTVLDVFTADGDSLVPQAFPEAADLAYVIYTSGSTGVPKGVMVGHAGVSALFDPTPAGLDTSADDVWLCAHSFAFDFSVWEVWGALTTGARLVIAEQPDLVDPARLARLVRDERVSVLSQTPGSLYRVLPPFLGLGESSPPRYVVLGGEALSWSRLASLTSSAPWLDTVFVNMYGITEGTIHVTIAEVPAAELSQVRQGNIGVALPSGRCYVLDERRTPVGVNVAGELYIGGPLVAKGYLGNPELTAERFLPDPFGDGVVYKTGDVVKWGTDGNLVYLGRNDTQVQVRGHRVECDEVERAFLSHPRVRSCAVAAEGDTLVAFVSGDLGTDADRELRAHVRTLLPGYMVPSRIAVVAAIPLTAHGKVDTRRLLAETVVPAPRAALSAGTSLEERIRRIWVDVLGNPDVGLHDNFFDLGGHSFALITMQERMAREGLEISVTDLFRSGTVAACAAQFQPAAATLPQVHVKERRAGRVLLAERRRRSGGGDHG